MALLSLRFNYKGIDYPYPVVPIYELANINPGECAIFLAMVIGLSMISLLGNLCSLYVNSRRKLRPFFRACLISLACSDVSYTVTFTTAYIANCDASYLELWTLGPFMCGFVPFVNTATIMASSLIIIAIALDRYMAIKCAVSSIWNPTLLFCSICIGGIWLISFACATPLFVVSVVKKIYIQTSEEQLVSEMQLASMCLGMRQFTRVYNVILLSLIFLPCIVAFVFLNATIARQLWQRRHHQHQVQHQVKRQEKKGQEQPAFVYMVSKPETTYAMMTAFSVAASFDMCTEKLKLEASQPPVEQPVAQPVEQSGPNLSPAAAARVVRHRRMVRVVVLMMATFICLRLPAWIFLIMRLYGDFSTPVDWMLYFTFGLLNLTSCALNPLFYSFLPQTISVLSQLKQRVRHFCCCLHDSDKDDSMPRETADQAQRCLCCGLHFTWRCHPKFKRSPAATDVQPDTVETEPIDNVSNLPHFHDKGEIFTIYNDNAVQANASIESSS